LFFLSLVFHDYGMDAPIVSTPFSVNLAFAASVFLISRVESDQLAFYLMSLSMCAFSFWPRLRNALIAKYIYLAPILLLFLFPITVGLLASSIASIPLAVMHTMLHIFICLLCPYLLIKLQQYKNIIHGPWDEATLKAST